MWYSRGFTSCVSLYLKLEGYWLERQWICMWEFILGKLLMLSSPYKFLLKLYLSHSCGRIVKLDPAADKLKADRQVAEQKKLK